MIGDLEQSDAPVRALVDAASSSDDGWIGIAAAARHLAIPARTMYRLAQLRQVPGVKVGRTWRFKRSALDAHLERESSAAPPPPPAAPPPPSAAPPPPPGRAARALSRDRA